MKKLRNITIAAVLVVAAGWSAVWYFGRDRVDTVLDGEIARLRSQGVDFQYASRTLGGFPFAYRVSFGDVTLRDPGSGALYRLPRIATEIRAASPDRMVTLFPEKFRVELPLGSAGRTAMPGMPEVLAIDVEARHLEVVTAGLMGPGRRFLASAESVLAVTGAADQPINLAVEFKGLDAQLDVPPAGTAALRATASRMEYAYSGAGADGTAFLEGSADTLTVTGTTGNARAGVIAALAGLVPAQLAFQTGTTEWLLRMVGPDRAEAGAVGLAAGSSAGTFESGSGTVSLNAASRANRATVIPAAPAGGLPEKAFAGTIEAVELQLKSPILPAPDVTPVTLRLALDRVTPDADVWERIDAAGKLPRDPARLILDLEGTGRITLAAPEPAVEAAPLPRLELGMLSVKAADLTMMGASMTARGDLAFKQPHQRPLGKVIVKMTNAFSLARLLADAGLIERGFAQAAILMGTGFTAPGEAPGERVAEIEMTRDGIRVNGVAVGH